MPNVKHRPKAARYKRSDFKLRHHLKPRLVARFCPAPHTWAQGCGVLSAGPCHLEIGYEPGMSVTVTLNGENRVLPGALSIDGLLRELGLDARKVAVERNLEIVPKSAFTATRLSDGDNLEIVHFIGGG